MKKRTKKKFGTHKFAPKISPFAFQAQVRGVSQVRHQKFPLATQNLHHIQN